MKALHLLSGAILFLAATGMHGAEAPSATPDSPRHAASRGVFHVQNEGNRNRNAARRSVHGKARR